LEAHRSAAHALARIVRREHAVELLVEHSAIGTARKHLPVCVLDDESAQVDLFTTRLEKDGFPVFGTTDPQAALQKVRLGSCRAVLADIKMPLMDGLTFVEKALKLDPGMYVILVTGYYSVDSAIDGIKRGAYDYLCKPLDFRRLERALDDLAEAFCGARRFATWKKSFPRTCNFKASWGKAR
jgi:DNA-binding NtrC family response regulator